MSLLSDRQRGVASPTLAPSLRDVEQPRGGLELTIGLINTMPDPALKATERQFMRLLQAAAPDARIRFHCFSLPSVPRSEAARWRIDSEYTDIAELGRMQIDGLIVTGAEPKAATLREEAFWQDLTGIVDWARTNTRSTIFSCLAAHAAVLHLDGIERQPLGTKCSGIFDCVPVAADPLTSGLPSPLKISHSRLNELRESDLVARGYRVLTHSAEAGVDIFTRQFGSHFVFFQGHPEYDALSLQREYLRDIARYLSGERDAYPAIPYAYFDRATESRLTSFRKRAGLERTPALAAELPALTLRPDIAAGTAAGVIFRNWVETLAEGALVSRA